MTPEPFRPAPAGRLLTKLHLLQAWRRLASVREQSKLLSSVILVFVISYAAFSFWLFFKGLRFIQSFPGLGTLLTERLLYLLFAFLFILLLFSNLIISYTNLFRNRETLFLLSLPVPRDAIFRWKFFESTLLASWAFLFLIAPLLAAYGLTRGVPWHFYFATVGLICMFVFVPAFVGSWMAVGLARFLDRRAFQAIVIGLGCFGLLAIAFWLKPDPISDEALETRVLNVLDRLLAKTDFSLFPLLPSYWLSTGVIHWAEGAFITANFFALVLLSYVLFFGLLSFTRMGDLFFDGVSRVHSRGAVFHGWGWLKAVFPRRRDRRYRVGWLEWVLIKIMPRQPGVRAMIIKDIRLFWRDTTQWGQTLVLFGLLGAYALNLRHFSHQLTNPFWINLVSYLNLGACSLNLATLTTRFVYPQFSLEGKRLWIIGMAPMGLSRVVWIKFALASLSSWVVTFTLILVSCRMLDLTIHRTVYFAIAITLMTLAMNGLAVGLGALYPNFKEDNPSKIVSGFGGTFCLVLSFLYIVLSVALLAVGSPWGGLSERHPWLAVLSVGGFLGVSLLMGLWPLRMGVKRAANFEI